MEDGVFKRFCHHSIEGILKRAEVRIASPPGDDFTAYGYAVLEPGIIHFVFVRPSWRKMGIAKRLLEGVDVSTSTITTWSPDVSGFSGWIRNKYKSFRYVPFYMREGDEERKRKVEARHG
jgi:GNAT superfamily N-acetyltransferase